MLKVIEGDLLQIREGFICHQVNCRGVMGGGIAVPIKKAHPEMFSAYRELCEYALPSSSLLGSCQVVRANTASRLWVVNIFGQDGFGNTRCTNYGAVGEAFRRLAAHVPHLPVYIPYLMGCGLAGGDWETYQEIVEFHLPNAIVVKLPEST